MRKWFGILYWICVVVLLSLVLVSSITPYGAAMFVSVSVLPGVFCAKYFMKDISFATDRKAAVRGCIYLPLCVLFLEYLLIIYTLWYLGIREQTPTIILNPIFIWLIISVMVFGEIAIAQLLPINECEKEKYIEFISERKKISLELASITFLESNDTEVLIHTLSGETYRTRMKISRWEAILDDRFIRIHRSFIVNINNVDQCRSASVHVHDRWIDVSRKYKYVIREKFGDGKK